MEMSRLIFGEPAEESPAARLEELHFDENPRLL